MRCGEVQFGSDGVHCIPSFFLQTPCPLCLLGKNWHRYKETHCGGGGLWRGKGLQSPSSPKHLELHTDPSSGYSAHFLVMVALEEGLE